MDSHVKLCSMEVTVLVSDWQKKKKLSTELSHVQFTLFKTVLWFLKRCFNNFSRVPYFIVMEILGINQNRKHKFDAEPFNDNSCIVWATPIKGYPSYQNRCQGHWDCKIFLIVLSRKDTSIISPLAEVVT